MTTQSPPTDERMFSAFCLGVDTAHRHDRGFPNFEVSMAACDCGMVLASLPGFQDHHRPDFITALELGIFVYGGLCEQFAEDEAMSWRWWDEAHQMLRNANWDALNESSEFAAAMEEGFEESDKPERLQRAAASICRYFDFAQEAGKRIAEHFTDLAGEAVVSGAEDMLRQAASDRNDNDKDNSTGKSKID